MFKLLKIIFGVITLSLASYGLITKNFEFQPVMTFFMGLFILIIGIEEFKKGRRGFGILSIAVCLFAIFVSFQGFLLN